LPTHFRQSASLVQIVKVSLTMNMAIQKIRENSLSLQLFCDQSCLFAA
jgi:hypothetical protein